MYINSGAPPDYSIHTTTPQNTWGSIGSSGKKLTSAKWATTIGFLALYVFCVLLLTHDHIKLPP